MISQGFPSYELDHTPASIVALEEARLLEPARRICRRAQTRRRDQGPLSTTQTLATENRSLEMKTAIWVAAIASTALIFDGYDLVVYGTVMPTLMNDPSQIGPLDPSIAGTVGSLALIGVLLGSFASGFIGDILGRKRMLMIGIAWFSIGMAITALTGTVFTFGLLRFLTGLGLGLVIATAGPIMAEFAPKDRRGVFNAIVYSGVPAGGMFASLCGIFLGEAIGWRGLFLIGATPILFLFPLAALKLPESPRWLLACGHEQRAIEVANRTGVPLQEELMVSRAASDRLGKPQNVIATTFALAAITLVLVTFHFPLPLLFLFIAVAGVGILGTQVLAYGFQSNYYTSNARAAGVAMCATIGRAGGVFGPMVIGWLVAAGLGASQQFYVFAVVALRGTIVTVLVPRKHNTYLIERRLLIDGDAKPEEVQAAREAAAESPLVEDGAFVPAQGPRTGA